MPVRADGMVVDWAASIRAAWDISEAGALRQMDVFLDAGEHRPWMQNVALDWASAFESHLADLPVDDAHVLGLMMSF